MNRQKTHQVAGRMQSGRERRSERRVAFSAVISAFALANLFVPVAFDGMAPSRFVEKVGFFLSGGLVAEACVLAIWGAMAASPAKYRIPASAGLLLVGVCTCVVGFRTLDDTFPLSIALLLVGLALGMFTGLLVPLWLVRLVMTTLLLLYLMRSLGYRLVGRRGEDPFAAIVAETVEATPSGLSPPNSEVQ